MGVAFKALSKVQKEALVETRWASLHRRADAMETYTCAKRNLSHGVANGMLFNLPTKISISHGFPRDGERGLHRRDELGGCRVGHTPGVDNMPQNLVNWADRHVGEFVKTDGVLVA